MSGEDRAAMVEDIEIDLLLEGVYRAYGVDLRRAVRAPVRAMVFELMRETRAHSVTALLDQVLHDRAWGRQASHAMSAAQLELFSDAAFFAAFRGRVIPWLRTYPFSSIWVLETGNGGMAYSVAILLEEAGIYDRARIYATDSDAARLPALEEGGLAPACLQLGEANYRLAGGAGMLRDHFTLREGRLVASEAIKRNIVWSEYDVEQGETFNEFQLIVCRNVITNMLPSVRQRVLRLLTESLALSGVLALGAKEKPDVAPFAAWYRTWDDAAGLHQRVR